MEVFNPTTLTFTTLKTKLPEKNSSCCSFIENGQLVVVSNHYVTRWADLGLDVKEVECRQHEEWVMWGLMAPLVEGKTVYFSSRKGCCRVQLEGNGWSIVAK